MPNLSVLKIALCFLGVALLMCLGGVIWLASANPARAIPDVLVGTTGLIAGGFIGILVPANQQGILGKAVARRQPAVVEKPGGMRAPVDPSDHDA